MYSFPADLKPDDNGTILVGFLDAPISHTFGGASTTRESGAAAGGLESVPPGRTPARDEALIMHTPLTAYEKVVPISKYKR
jgi:hypothetical protein